MKKFLAFSLLAFVVAMLAAWTLIDSNDMVVSFGDRDIDGPLGALLGTAIAGGVFAIVAVVLTVVAVLVGVVMAGVGVLMLCGLALGVVVAVAAMSPLFLPLLLPFAIYWLMKRKGRQQAAAPSLGHTPA
ncbi:hypothetical protein [Pseudoduganella violaceinigra]|uniref:hypothetical protein n=1 Tax=Pseudoduganella violaceinigra TaxID=246602 RepID=UPI00040D8C2C|nr:hypothetical protein [Pseudoduganella violaceinigra]